MAAIDGLIGLLDFSAGADALVLASNQAPTLIAAGAKRPLTMPPLDTAALEGLLAELLDADRKSRLDAEGAVDLAHVAPRVGAVTVQARRGPEGLSLRISRGGAARAPVPAAPPPRAARSSPAPEAPEEPARSGWAVVRRALRRGASDVWLSTSAAPAIRVAGEVEELALPPWSREALLELLALSAAQRAALERSGSVDLAIQGRAEELGEPASRRFRVNLFAHLGGLTAALRPLWQEIPSAAELHLPARLLSLVAPRSGLALVAGLAGSGKSTTLAVLLEHLNETRARHVVTLEDPIEYVFRRRRSVIHQREVGTHVDSFASGLRAALRESPDVILLGEMRDRETVALALTAAETGHLVLSTIHSASAAMAVDRIVDVFPEAQQQQVRAQLAGVLRSVVTQRLLEGRAPGTRVPVVELLAVNHAVAAQIREGKTHLIANQMQVGADDGMLPFDRSLVDLARRGLITGDRAVEAARDRGFVEGAVAGLQ